MKAPRTKGLNTRRLKKLNKSKSKVTEMPTKPDLKVVEENKPEIIVCGYHARCMDGLGTLAAAKVYAGRQSWELVPVPLKWGEKEPGENLKAIHKAIEGKDLKELIIGDFCLKLDELKELCRTYGADMSAFYLFDHHDSNETTMYDFMKWAQQEGYGNVFTLFDNNCCGATITWEELNPSIRVPDIFRYIQDRDLWKWQLKDSREVSAGLEFFTDDKRDVKGLLSVIDDEALGIQMCVEQGTRVLEHKREFCEGIACAANDVKTLLMGSLRVEVLLVPAPLEHSSEIGEILYKRYPEIDAIIMYSGVNEVNLSIRSTNATAKVIAEFFGGGGHPGAAGAKISFHTFRELMELPDSKLSTKFKLKHLWYNFKHKFGQL